MGHGLGEGDTFFFYQDKLIDPSEKTALLHIRIRLVPGWVTSFMSVQAVSVTTSTSKNLCNMSNKRMEI